MTILLVEDDKACSGLIHRAIEPLAETILITGKLSEARKLIQNPDIVMAWYDLTLDDAGPLETIEEIRAVRARNPCIVILVMTGSMDAETERLCTMAGVDAYALKPTGFTPFRIISIVSLAVMKAMRRGADGNSGEFLERVTTAMSKALR